MGYGFTVDEPHDGVGVGCGFDNERMSYVRMVMIEAGVLTGDGVEAVFRLPGLEPEDESLPVGTFIGVGARVTGAQAAFIAERTRRAVRLGVIPDLLEFLDDAPPSDAVQEWVEQFAAFNERAVSAGGYHVV
ncbi:hypothetical protein AB0K04_14675 [Micromonospora coxensis]|uniref:hypothetical protein n=1 Tax=Micromonospora coxensis TaxID=356852 RepID=UPI00342C1013